MSYYFPPQKKPQRWGSVSDIQYAIRKNFEKIYGVDPDSNVLVMPLFWGFPCLDFSGKQNHGTPVGGVAYHSNTLSFDGVNDYVDCGSLVSSGITNTFSIAAYIKVASNNYSVHRGIVAFPTYPLSYLTRTLVTYGYIQFYVWTTSGNNQIDGLLPVVGVWQQVVFTYDGSNIRIYQDAIQTGIAALSGNLIQYGDNTIIGQWRPSEGFNGLISDVRINNTPLTAEQIALFYDLPYGLYQPVNRPVYFFPAVRISMPIIMQQINQFNGGQISI